MVDESEARMIAAGEKLKAIFSYSKEIISIITLLKR